ncbi:PcfJ domain-containing protein [Rhizobium sp. BK176]|uniref:PcfJ domain-containing protein n=1 Tax=Rhizobium sp. BK176 TaxID=2587071 RepID=UPI0021694D3F|nr:PcfJ domain-containing protein [Rhizobium sp. BK176]MCS4089756.1 hypothetical protein [Rhizobium sp. BK176]
MEDPGKETKSRFGSKVASDMYARLKKVSSEAKILKVYEVETTETETRIKIFNSWMMTRNLETGAVGTFERDYALGSWYEVEPNGVFHAIPVWPIHNLSHGVANGAKKFILDKLYDAVGFNETKSRLAATWRAEVTRLAEAENIRLQEAEVLATERFPDVQKLEIARNAFADKLFGSKFSRGTRKPAKGFVGQEAVYNALKGVRAEFFRQFRDPELFRAILAMNHKFMSIGDYLYFAANRDAVLKVWKERRNLIPLLPYISRHYWAGDELFSTAKWTDPVGPLSDPGFNLIPIRNLPSQHVGRGMFSPFESSRGYQWLSRSKSTVVKAWARGRKNNLVTDLMAELNLPKDTAVLVIANIVDQMDDAIAKLERGEVGEDRQRFLTAFRAYAAHWAAVRREHGYRRMVRALTYENEGTGNVIDFLVAQGFADNLPARNATWASLIRRSHEWHQQQAALYRNRMPAAGGGYDYFRPDDQDLPREWVSLVPTQEILECKVRPIDQYDGVAIEGGEMAHCVGSYAHLCARDRYRVYSITEPDGTRSTLGFHLEDGSAYFDQVQGFGNSRPSELVKKVAHQVVGLYADAIAAQAIAEKETA